MEPQLGVLVFKPLLYWGVFAVARAWSEQPEVVPWWKPLLATLVRVVGGLVVGIPLAIILLGCGQTEVVLGFSLFRVLLWLLCLGLFFDLRPHLQVILALVATGLNWAADFLAFGGLWTDFFWHGCC
jgi:hypothetical protein